MGLLDGIGDFVSGAADAVGSAVSSVGDFVYEIGSDVLGGVYKSMESAWSSGVFDDLGKHFDLSNLFNGTDTRSTTDDLFSNAIVDKAVNQWNETMPDSLTKGGDSVSGGLIDFAKSETGQNLAKLGLGYVIGQEKQKQAEKLIERANKSRKKFRGAYYV